MRTVTVTGHIVADAEKKISKTGKEYLSFRIANNEFNDEKDGEGKQKPYWYGITSLNSRHFNMAQHLTKGKPIIVEGDYSDRIYQNREGNCEIARDILANAIYFLPTSGDNGNSQKTNEASVTTQTVMKPKPTTDEIKVPQATVNTDDTEQDDLPF